HDAVTYADADFADLAAAGDIAVVGDAYLRPGRIRLDPGAGGYREHEHETAGDDQVTVHGGFRRGNQEWNGSGAGKPTPATGCRTLCRFHLNTARAGASAVQWSPRHGGAAP